MELLGLTEKSKGDSYGITDNDPISCSSPINSFEKGRQWQLAVNLLGTMCQKNVSEECVRERIWPHSPQQSKRDAAINAFNLRRDDAVNVFRCKRGAASSVFGLERNSVVCTMRCPPVPLFSSAAPVIR